jgi:hypothetical protein
MHFAWSALGLARRTTLFATLWCTEVLRSVKLLFTLCERKYGTAIAAGDLLIGHENMGEKRIEMSVSFSAFLSDRSHHRETAKSKVYVFEGRWYGEL